MAFRNKAGAILALKPDILIVQECENLEKLKFHADLPVPNDEIWFGQNANKGLAVFSFSDLRINKLNDHNVELRMVVPLSVRAKNVNLLLFAIWANNPADKDGQYIE
jgi:hypothetical protein